MFVSAPNDFYSCARVRFIEAHPIQLIVRTCKDCAQSQVSISPWMRSLLPDQFWFSPGIPPGLHWSGKAPKDRNAFNCAWNSKGPTWSSSTQSSWMLRDCRDAARIGPSKERIVCQCPLRVPFPLLFRTKWRAKKGLKRSPTHKCRCFLASLYLAISRLVCSMDVAANSWSSVSVSDLFL